MQFVKSLTPRQSVIVDLASQGFTDKQIAMEMEISHHTVHTHWKDIRICLGISSRSEAVAIVLCQKLKDQVMMLHQAKAVLNEQLTRQDETLREVLSENSDLKRTVSLQAEVLRALAVTTRPEISKLQEKVDLIHSKNPNQELLELEFEKCVIVAT